MKLPPIEKIYEAYSAIADHRVELKEDHAIVTSSNGERKYLIQWKNGRYTSTDPATHFHGYPGYPVLAVWMLQGRLTYCLEHVKYFSNIDWNTLNKKCKRNYQEAVEEVFAMLNIEAEKKHELISEVDRLYSELNNLEEFSKVDSSNK